jgi:RHS repeat-associated protein
VVWSGDYKPFGEVTSTVSTIQNQFRFPGQYYDQESALQYNYHRYYQAKPGRYLTPDPIGLKSGTNLYLYVNNNPINTVDPYGNIGIPGVIVGAISGATGGFISGGWKGALIGSVVGAGVGLFAPIASYTIASTAGNAVSAGSANLFGQLLGNVFDNNPGIQFSPLSLTGAAIGGSFAPLWANISALVMEGSLIAEGIISGALIGYLETVGWLFDNFDEYLSEYNKQLTSQSKYCDK